MSEHITHIAVFEDTARLYLNSPDICEPFKTVTKNQYDSCLIACGSRGNHLFSVPIIEEYTKSWAAEKNNKKAQIKMAFAIGWITHRASDKQTNAIDDRNGQNPDPRYDGQTSAIYQDANSFEKVYDSGKKPPLSENEALQPSTFDYDMRSHPAAKVISVKKSEPLFSWMWQKDLQSMHIFSHQEKDFEKWLDTYVSRWPKFSEDFREYEKAHMDPDPVLEKKYYQIDNLYNEKDALIRFVRAIQKDQKPSVDLKTALQNNENDSEYAKAVRRSYVNVKALSDFFTGKISKDSAYDIVEINKNERI
jgi:hypothetical protein